jgi:two-component system LytT family response regulator
VALEAGVTIVAEATTGSHALRVLHELRPDLVFLDIHLPEGSGLDLVRQLPAETGVILTTAYDRYAVQAFELGAVDYLLKPFGAERLHLAVERARHERQSPAELPSGARARAALGETRPLTRLFVRDGERIVPVRVLDISRIEADGDYSALHVGRRRHLVNVPVAELEALLDPERFVRVHRAHIVNWDQVRALIPYDAHRLTVELLDGTRITASRSRTRTLKSRIL